MPFNGSGTFSLVAGNPVVTGTVISSTIHNNTNSDFATGFTNCVTRDGQSAALANLPMGGNKHTGAAAGSATGEYLTYGQTSASLSSATIGTLSVTGNANINGNTTIGDAGTDTLTVNAATTVNGSVTLGDAAADAVTVTGTMSVTPQAAFVAGLTVGNVERAGATVLDWYDEGLSFTPSVTFGGGSTGITYVALSQEGNAVRIGNTVHFRLAFQLSNKGSSTGTAVISGLPVAASSTGASQWNFSFDAQNMTGLTGAVQAIGVTGSALIVLRQWGASGTALLTDAAFTNTTAVYVSGSYQVVN